MARFFLKLTYDGTDFCGWQKQKGTAALGRPSIQETIETTLSQITSQTVRIVGSGRTDAGVHALGQVAHFDLEEPQGVPTDSIFKGLNSLLPRSIRALELKTTHQDFHAQRSAKKKQYSFYYQQGVAALPHLCPYSWWIRKPLDLAAMQKSIQALVGEHDFKPFQAAGAAPGPTTVRTIFEAEVSLENLGFPGTQKQPAELIRLRLVGSGFLKQMVRGIAGTLVQIGEGKRPSSAFAEILASQDRSLLGATAPGRALWLDRVDYPMDL